MNRQVTESKKISQKFSWTEFYLTRITDSKELNETFFYYVHLLRFFFRAIFEFFCHSGVLFPTSDKSFMCAEHIKINRLLLSETHYSTEISYQTCGTIVSVESASDVTFFQEISASRGDGFQSSGFSTALVCQVRASSNADVNYKRIEHIPAQISYHNDVFPISLNAFVSSASSGKLSRELPLLLNLKTKSKF